MIDQIDQYTTSSITPTHRHTTYAHTTVVYSIVCNIVYNIVHNIVHVSVIVMMEAYR